MSGRAKEMLKGRSVYFLVAVFGMAIGGLLAGCSTKELGAGAFAGGFAHAVPGVFSYADLISAALWQFAPFGVLWYAAFGALLRPTATVVIALRSVIGGYCAVAATKIFAVKDWFTILLLVFFCLFELLMITLCVSCAYRAEIFSGLVGKLGVRKRPVAHFSSDILFYCGLIIFFYIARGCVVALLNT